MFDLFFTILRKSLIALLFVVVGFTFSYVPQVPSSQVGEAHAGGLSGIATEWTQLANNALLGSEVVQSTITAGATAANWLKDSTLDGIGWAITQRIVANMIRSTLSWVASGFQGSPSFVTDLRGFLLNAADEEIGSIIESFGGIASFICSPFRLDVQVSIAMQYSRSRDTQQSAPSCTLSGVVDNIEGFISGIDPGNGLSDWINITATPQTYTPYGAVLSAEATARARLINAQGEELNLLGFGDGFLSQQVCRDVAGAPSASNRSECSITTPGKVISEQVNKAMGLPADLAVSADEINEAIVTGLTSLVSRALTGTAGLLGLSGGDGFGGYSAGPSFLDDIVDQTTNQAAGGGSANTISDAASSETTFRDQAEQMRSRFAAFAANVTNPPTQRSQAQDVVDQIDASLVSANENIAILNVLNDRFLAGDNNARVDALIEFTDLQSSLEGSAAGSGQIANWRAVANSLDIELDS